MSFQGIVIMTKLRALGFPVADTNRMSKTNPAIVPGLEL